MRAASTYVPFTFPRSRREDVKHAHDRTSRIDRLFATIASRKSADPKRSYTAQLLKRGVAQCAKKFGEEGVEAVLAAVAGTKKELVAESADVLYHLLVVWAARGVKPKDGLRRACARAKASPGWRKRASRKKQVDAQSDFAGFFGHLLTRSSTRLRTFGSLILMKARLSCRPSPLETNSITGGEASFSAKPRPPSWLADALVEIVDRHAQDARDVEQAPGADAVDALLVFLDLLKREAEQFAQPLLTHADQHAPQPDAIADLGVDRDLHVFLARALHDSSVRRQYRP